MTRRCGGSATPLWRDHLPRKFRSDARAARQSEAAERNFRWLRLNQWIATKDVGWMPLTLYDKTQWTRPEWRPLSAPARRQAARDVLEGKTCYGGLDLSTTTDLTALTLIFPPQEGLDTWTTLFWAWRPEDGVLEAEQRDHVPYRDWGRAGFLELCPGTWWTSPWWRTQRPGAWSISTWTPWVWTPTSPAP